MSNITLREYYQEVETLVAQGRLDEVVAHCRHILKFFPKDVAVYRLLGKSYLESRRLSDATDILQRVLSVVPDDFVSHVGMSLIREDEGNLDAAIWHMERAFEVQPSNSAIRDEVRRLFGKRDGMEPPKIRLTRGALARMYANGNLYQQSISELRSALSEEPQRFDLLVLLARMYYLNGQHVDAAEVCNTLLNKLPFCLDANRILAAVLVNSGRESEAEMYNERLQVLDPYTPHAPPGSLDSDGAQNSAVTLPHLEWEPGQEVPGTDSHPSWASSLGIDIGDSVSEENDVPAWLQDDEAGGESALESAEITEMDILGIPADSEGLESPPEASIDDAGETHETVDATAEAEDLIPDWMKDSGWATAEGEEPSPESTAASEDEEPGESRVDAGVSAPQNGEMPDWLKDMAPDALDSTPEELDLAEEDMSGEIPGWLSSQAPGSTDSVVMWLEEKPDTKNLPKTGPLPSIDPETGEDVPDWLDSVVSSMENSGAADAVDDVDEEAEEASVPGLAAAAGVAAAASSSDWLKGEESAAPIDPEEDTRPRGTGELVAPAVTSGDERPAEDEPDQSFPAESGELSEAAEPFLAEESPVLDEEISGIDWNLGEAEATTAAGPAGEMDTEEDMPEWLTGSGSGEHEVSFEELADQEPSTEEAVPDWLTEMEKEATELSADTGAEVEFGKTEVAEAEFSEIPPWIAEAEQASEDPPAELPDIDSIAASPVDAGTAGHREESGELPSEDDQDAALAWLEGLAMKQGVDEEELVTSPEDRDDAPPEWVSETMQGIESESGAPHPETAAEAADQEPAEWAIDTLGADESTEDETPPWAEETMTSASKTERIPESEETPNWATETMTTVTDEEAEERPDWATETMPNLGRDEDTPAWATEIMASAEEEAPEWAKETLDSGEPEPESEQTGLDWAADTQTSLTKATGEPIGETEVPDQIDAEVEPEAFETLESSEDRDWMRETQIPQIDFEDQTIEEDAPEATADAAVSGAAQPGEPSDWMVETAVPDLQSLSDEAEPMMEMPAGEPPQEQEEDSEEEAEWMLETNIPSAAGFKDPTIDQAEEEPENIGAGLAAAAAGIGAAMMADSEAEDAQSDEHPEWMVETALPDTSTFDDVDLEGGAVKEAKEGEKLETVAEGSGLGEFESPAPEPAQDAPTEAEIQIAEPEVKPEPVRDRFTEMLADAQSSLADGDVQAAVETYRKLIRRKKNLPEIIADLEEAVYRYPVDTNILESLADAYSGSNRLQDALDAYTKAEELLH